MKFVRSLRPSWKDNVSLIIATAWSLTAWCQPDYNFGIPTLVSGTDRQINAVYRYSGVKPGVDALVTITGFAGGASLDSFDRRATGYLEAFQPMVRVPAFSNGYAEFRIDFVIGGTSTPMIQPTVPISPIDVDGFVTATDSLYETDQLNLGGGFVDYDMSGNQIFVYQSGNWFIGRNIGGVDYPGIDTSVAARAVMFSVVNANISTLTVRMGEDNHTASSNARNRSVYFKQFTYSHSFLPINPLRDFNGTVTGNQIKLNWELNVGNDLQSIVLEKSNNSTNFEPIAEYWPGLDENKQNLQASYKDVFGNSGTVYYRLKMTGINNSVRYSTMLAFRNYQNENITVQLFPTVTNDLIHIRYFAKEPGNVKLTLYDISGRMMMQRNLPVSSGWNDCQVDGLSKFLPGNYYALIWNRNEHTTIKIIVE